MDPQLEFFLEDAFNSLSATSPQIGRVVAEPDYDVTPDEKERDQVAAQLIQCVQEQSPDAAKLASPQGYEIKVPGTYPVLAKYIRKLILYRNPKEEPWVEVAPPGNWI
jgi:hypothetical protein